MFLVQGHNIVTSSPHTFYSSAGTHRPPLTDTPGTSAHQKIQNLTHLRNEKVPWVNIDILNDIETSSYSFLDQLSRIFLSKNHQDMNRNANGKPEKNNLFDVGMVKRRENRGKLFNNYIHSFLCR